MTKVSCFSNSRRGPPPPAPPSTPAAAPAAAQAGQSHSQEQKLLRRVDEELKQSARKDLWNLVFIKKVCRFFAAGPERIFFVKMNV